MNRRWCLWFILVLFVGSTHWSVAHDLTDAYRLEKRGQSLVQELKAAGIEADFEWMTMRDGTRLAATVAKPFIGSKYPAILIRTPYGRNQLDIGGALLPLSGYAVVIQDMRGRYESEGTYRVFQDDGWGEKQDGYDSVQWIAQQSWSNGKIATWGPSALGIVQELMVVTNPPNLVCQFIGYAAVKGYGQAAYQGGVFRTSLVQGWLGGQDSLSFLSEFKAHPTDDAYWSQYDIDARVETIEVPSLYLGGFYDCFEQGTIQGFTARQYRGGEGARGKNRLILGPWTHTNESSQTQGQLSYPGNSVMSYTDQIQLVLEWLNYWMKGLPNGALDGDPVKYYLMGAVGETGSAGNVWRTSPVWPPENHTASLYFHADGRMDPYASDDDLQTLSFDPQNAILTRGGANLEIAAGPYDQQEIEARNDVLTFTTEPLTAPLEVVGNIHAVIYASCNLSDMDLSVRLTDVYPDGRSMLLCDGILRAGFRDGFTQHVPLQPGEVYRFDVDLWSTAIAFNTGHRIRVAIGNANVPRFELNPAYSNVGLSGYPDRVETAIVLRTGMASAIELPVIAPGPGEHPLLPLDTDIIEWMVY